MPITKSAVETSLLRAFIGPEGGLREEDHQKVCELVPLLLEIDRLLPRRGGLHVVDACAGKSAVGVLIAAHVLSSRAPTSRVTAIEREPKRRALFLRAADALGVAAQSTLVTADVADDAAWPDAPDLVVALHACGAASDTVIDQAVRVRAVRVVLVPCCYGAAPGSRDEAARSSEVAGQGLADTWARAVPLPGHALVGRRFAQALIDAERTLRLEAAGYQCDVVELFSPTVSPFNLAWRARRVDEPVRRARALAQLEALRAGGPRS